MNDPSIRHLWSNTGQARPDFAIEPEAGQESVWDYPRPPIARRDGRLVEVLCGGKVIATTTGGYKVMETASPPTYYLPPQDVDRELLIAAPGASVCEWKGAAVYWTLASKPGDPVAWSYPRPKPRFDKIKDYFAFYPGRVACYVDGERVKPQSGRFYGGWITSDVVGPFKGDPGTGHW